MANYKNNPTIPERNRRRQKFFEEKKVHSLDEAAGLSSEECESDSLVSKNSEFSKEYKPQIKAKDPSTFAYFGSAEQYYNDAIYNIINYYPFDGTREEVLDWHRSSSYIDAAVLRQYWPGSTGHFTASYKEYVSFYAGPNKIPEAESIGSYKHKETGLSLDPTLGNTVEFQLKKEAFHPATNPSETVFDIGTYPGKLAAADSGHIKLELTASSGSPFRISYKSGNSEVSQMEIGSSRITTSSVADSLWHHYSFVTWVEDSELKTKLYVDGEYDSKIRAINMVEALTKLKSKRKGNGLKRTIKNKNRNKSNLYFVIHPMLRSIVFKKKKFYK